MHPETILLMDFQQSYWVLDGGLATEMENRGFSIQVRVYTSIHMHYA